MAILANDMPTQQASFKQPSSLSMQIPKREREMGKPCLTPILQLMSFDQPLMFLNLAITFSYIFITTTLNLKGTIDSSNLFHKLFLGIVSKAFLKSTKQ